LRDIEREDREKQAALDEKERQLKAKIEAREERDRVLKEYLQALPESNTDTGPVTRILSALTYVLPALDSLRYAVATGSLVPAMQEVVTQIRGPIRDVDEATFGLIPLTMFILFQANANNTDIPKLLRFNLRQSVVIAVVLFFPSVIGWIATFISRVAFGVTDQWGDWTPGRMPAWMSEPAAFLVFVFVMLCVVYGVVMSLLGEYARGIPGISAEAERTMAQTRDADLEKRLRKQLAQAEKLDADNAEKAKREKEKNK
jgi:hypothetical protein